MSLRTACVLFLAATLAGCTTTEMISFQVESNPSGARIEVNNLDRGVAPTTVQLEMKKTWSPFAPGGWHVHKTAYEVVAFPPESVKSGQRHTKAIIMKIAIACTCYRFDG